MIDLWSYESRGANGNVVDLVRSAQLTQKEHSGPGGVLENLAEGWGRPVQARRAVHTQFHSQGEPESIYLVNNQQMIEFSGEKGGVG